MNLLFICSRNQWRSPTAERVYATRPGHATRSAGTASSARHRVSARDLEWADIVFVMEDDHRRRLRADFPAQMRHRSCHTLHIPDDYGYMDPELITMLTSAVDAVLERG